MGSASVLAWPSSPLRAMRPHICWRCANPLIASAIALGLIPVLTVVTAFVLLSALKDRIPLRPLAWAFGPKRRGNAG